MKVNSPEWTAQIIRDHLLELDKKDRNTFDHCNRVAALCQFIAATLGLSLREQKIAFYVGLLHDIGKIQIPDSILLKPGRLTPEEKEVMNTHPMKSVQLLETLQGMADLKDISLAIKHHHEQMDGKGYPDGLSGEQIPIASRIVLIADTFDAMTSDRPYRKGGSDEKSLQELQKHSETQFDQKIVQHFAEHYLEWKKTKQNGKKAA